uniref:HMG1/2 High mobility group protein n=1 Tax=Phallusia mammillata TaxID=59560 RepID=A0A6F9DFB8_9ASCI|nr:HMG1/2 High mobility group protein [Phallusia mammillata]
MPKKDPNKPRGRMTGYAYFVQTCREEHRKKHPNEQVIFAEFSRKCAKRWKEMNDKEKCTFTDMAEKDRHRYECEMKNYNPPSGEGKRKKKKKDPNAPKRPQSAFFLFCADRRATVKQENPSYTVGDIARELGKKWSETNPDIKSKYVQAGEKEKEKYNKEMAAYRATQEKGAPVAKKQKVEKPASSSSDSSSESDADSD